MSTKDGRKPDIWFAMYAEKFLWGTLKAELEVDERAVWVDFLCLAATFEGKIDITYPEKLAGMLVIPTELLKKAIEKFKKTKRVKILNDQKEGKVFAIITKWNLYQTEYLGGMRKIKGKKSDAHNSPMEKKAMRKTPIQDKTGEDSTGEDRRGEENLPQIPKNLEFKIQDNLRNLRAQIRDEKQWLSLSDEELLKEHRATKQDVEKDIEKLTTQFMEIIELHAD